MMKKTMIKIKLAQTDLVKIGLICLISTMVLSACVKKEQPKENEQPETAQTEVHVPAPTEPVTQDEPEYTMLEEVPAQNAETQQPVISETQESSNNTTAIPDTAPAISSNTLPTHDNNIPAAPAQVVAQTQHTDETASEDDAVAAAIKAAQPALQQ